MRLIITSFVIVFLILECQGQNSSNRYTFYLNEAQHSITYLSLKNEKLLIRTTTCVKGKKDEADTLRFRTLDKKVFTELLKLLLPDQQANPCGRALDDFSKTREQLEEHLFILFTDYDKSINSLEEAELAGELWFYKHINYRPKLLEFNRINTLALSTQSLHGRLRDIVYEKGKADETIEEALNGTKSKGELFTIYCDSLRTLAGNLEIVNTNRYVKKVTKAGIAFERLKSSQSLERKLFNRTKKKIHKANRIARRLNSRPTQFLPAWNNSRSNFVETSRAEISHNSPLKDSMKNAKDEIKESLNSLVKAELQILSALPQAQPSFSEFYFASDVDKSKEDLISKLNFSARLNNILSDALKRAGSDSIVISKVMDLFGSELDSIMKVQIAPLFSETPTQKGITEMELESLRKKSINALEQAINIAENKLAIGVDSAVNTLDSIDGFDSAIRDLIQAENDLFYKRIFAPTFEDDLPLTPNEVDIQFAGGTIENIHVRLQSKETGKWYTFHNWSPIPFKTQYDLAKLDKVLLFNHQNPKFPFYLRLSDVISFHPNLGIDANDYSPADGRVINLSESFRDVYSLRKWRLNNYLTIKVFSDIIGINESNPNGLVQIESRLTKISNSRYLGSSKWILARDISVDFNLTKVENKLRYIEGDRLGLRPNQPDSLFVNTLDLVRFSNFNTGIVANIGRFSSRKSNATLGLNVHFGLYSTPIRKINPDNTLTEFFPVSMYYAPEVDYKFKSGSNIGLDFSLKFISPFIVSDVVRQTKTQDYTTFNKINSWNDRLIVNPTVTLYYNPLENVNNRIFFRGSWFKSSINPANFLQVQFGYSAQLNNVLGNKKSGKQMLENLAY